MFLSLFLYCFCTAVVFTDASSVDTSKIKVIDIIPFNGEIFALYRLHYLKDVVDKFIVVESLVSFSGNKRSTFYLDTYKEIIDPIRDKVVEVRIEDIPTGDSGTGM